jgi:fructokinase
MGLVMGLGEMLWDLFPSEKHLGGAPVNFVYHCRQMGLDAWPVSRIGKDALGNEILAILMAKNIPADWVQIDETRPTGTVKVTMSGTNHTFTIMENVAWDFIETNDQLLASAKKADAVCFGTLAQRNVVSRETILTLVKACPGLKVYDINLRQNFFSKDIIENSLYLADVLKLNIDELWMLREMLDISRKTPEDIGRGVLSKYKLKTVCITRGGDGAMLIGKNEIAQIGGENVNVVDTVGCGDAFCAALVHGLLGGKSFETVVKNANRVGLFVAGQAGGTPVWTDELRASLK